MISIIIPTFNEGDGIANTIETVQKAANGAAIELLVVDGGSSDDTVAKARSKGIQVVVSERKGRAAQMNLGAGIATSDLLYFLHADTIPPVDFAAHIHRSVKEGYISGSFRLQFDCQHWFLKANSWFTRFNVNAVRFGDQSLFVTKQVFLECGGFREDLYMMEDQEIIHRIRRLGKFKVMPAYVVTSARKYLDNGIYRMQYIFYRIWAQYYLGYSQEYLLQLHRRMIRKHKL